MTVPKWPPGRVCPPIFQDGLPFIFLSEILFARHFHDIDSHEGGQRKPLFRKVLITLFRLVFLHERPVAVCYVVIQNRA